MAGMGKRARKDKPEPALDAATLRAFEEAAKRLVSMRPDKPSRKAATKTRKGKRS